MRRLTGGELFLLEVLAALDALPRPRLIREHLREGDDYCVVGALLRWRGIDVCNWGRMPLPEEVSGMPVGFMEQLMTYNDKISGNAGMRWWRVRKWIAGWVERERQHE